MSIEFIAENGQPVTTEMLDKWEAEYADSDWSHMRFDKTIHQLPGASKSTLSCKVPEGIKNAVIKQAKEREITISEFVKRAIVNELMRSA